MDATCSANGQRQSNIINSEILTMWATKERTTTQKTVKGTGTRHWA